MKKFTQEQKAVLILNIAAGLVSGKINKLTEEIPAHELVFDNKKHKNFLTSVAGETVYNKINAAVADSFFIEGLAGLFDAECVGIITKNDKEYPNALKEIATPPSMLYYKGNTDFLLGDILGIVGSRDPSVYGETVTERFAKSLAERGLTIVSGLAKGIDSIAHRAAIAAGGRTIAVLGCGINKIYPAENAALYKKMAEGHLLISEYAPGISAQTYTFPERNRIISGISRGVLITEARMGSGSLITADCAIEQGRNLYAIPCNVNSKKGEGSNKLIKENASAFVTSPDDIALDLGLKTDSREITPMLLDFTEAIIVDALHKRSLHFDELLLLTGLAVPVLGAMLSKMELMQIIQKLDNNIYGVY